MRYHHIFFDLDGTITDSALGITRSASYALKKFGIDADPKNLKKFVGPPLKDSFIKYYGFDEKKAVLAIQYYREYYTKTGINENSVYNGVSKMLKTLKAASKNLYIATSKPEQFARKIIENFGLLKYFDYIGGATMDEKMVNKLDIIKYVADTCAINNKSDIIMVGDREHDVLGAKAFNIDSIGVLYGYGDLKELKNAGASYIADTPMQVAEIILK